MMSRMIYVTNLICSEDKTMVACLELKNMQRDAGCSFFLKYLRFLKNIYVYLISAQFSNKI